jgi:hypothetical protein
MLIGLENPDCFRNGVEHEDDIDDIKDAPDVAETYAEVDDFDEAVVAGLLILFESNFPVFIDGSGELMTRIGKSLLIFLSTLRSSRLLLLEQQQTDFFEGFSKVFGSFKVLASISIFDFNFLGGFFSFELFELKFCSIDSSDMSGVGLIFLFIKCLAEFFMLLYRILGFLLEPNRPSLSLDTKDGVESLFSSSPFSDVFALSNGDLGENDNC